MNSSLEAKSKYATRVVTPGQVNDLKIHVNPQWWKYIFNSLFITDGDVVNDDRITSHEVDIFFKY